MTSSLHVALVRRSIRIGRQAIRFGQLSEGGLFFRSGYRSIEELFDNFLGLIADADDLNPFIRVGLLQLDDMRHARHAWTTPSRPELNDVYLVLLELGHFAKFAFAVLNPMLYIQSRCRATDGQQVISRCDAWRKINGSTQDCCDERRFHKTKNLLHRYDSFLLKTIFYSVKLALRRKEHRWAHRP